MEAVRKRVEHRKKVVEEAKKWAKNLPHKATAVLIGSYARGDFNLWSDVDILLITDLAGTPTKRLREIDHPPGYQIIPITPKEFQKLVDKKDPLAEDATKGIVLRDDYKIANSVSKHR